MRSDERTRQVPVVVLTSSNEERDVLRSYDLGANSFVQKPVDFSEFIDATRHIGLYWLVLNETSSGFAGRETGNEAETSSLDPTLT
jgi:CheY-like chemotaxis protein